MLWYVQCMYNVWTWYMHSTSTCIPMHVCTRVVPTVWIFSVPQHPSLEGSRPVKLACATLTVLPSQRLDMEADQENCAGPWSSCALAPPFHPKTWLLPVPCLQHLVSPALEKFFVLCAGIVIPLCIIRDMRLQHRTTRLYVFIAACSTKACICSSL
jgi:hypothetical protein